MAQKPMPLDSQRVFTLKGNKNDENHKYLVVSFLDSTLVLGITEGKITSIQDSGM